MGYTVRVTTRESLHELVDGIPESALDDAEASLRSLTAADESGLRRFLDEAPYDDEPLTDDERAAIALADAEFARGEGVPHSVVKKLLENWPT